MPIHLLVPGLLGPWLDSSLQQSLPALPMLEQLLARADRRPAPKDYPCTLFYLLDMPFQSPGSLPTANLCWLADTGQPSPANLLHADPIYLKPDMDNVQLFRPGNLNMEQAQAFAESFDSLYGDDGLRLHTPAPDRWYISMPQPLRTPGAALDQVTGRNLRSFIATEHQSRAWGSLFTEIQMLFHDLSVNRDRLAGGELPVSGLWLSGGGDPPPVGKHPIQIVQGDDLLLRGLAIHARLSHTDQMPPVDSIMLTVRQECHKAWLAMDFPAWLDAAQRIEESLGNWIQNGNQIILYPCNGQAWHWLPSSKYRLWRRKHGLAHYVKSR